MVVKGSRFKITLNAQNCAFKSKYIKRKLIQWTHLKIKTNNTEGSIFLC